MTTNAATINGSGTNGATTSKKALPEVVHANFNYSDETSQLTEVYFYDHPSAAAVHLPGGCAHTMPVHNAWSRNASKPFSVDVEGFELQPFKTAYTDWSNDEAVRSTFYPEIVEFLKRTTGASRVLVFDHTIVRIYLPCLPRRKFSHPHSRLQLCPLSIPPSSPILSTSPH
jgi:hypothetical protein